MFFFIFMQNGNLSFGETDMFWWVTIEDQSTKFDKL